MPNRPFSLSGGDLSTARRALAVALVVDAATDDLHEVRTLLPDRVDMLTVLDEIGWPGAHEAQAGLAPTQVRVLEAVVYATLILALEEGETSAYSVLRSTAAAVDPATLIALESLAGLALRLRAPSRVVETPGSAALAALGDSLISPALSALADALALPVWIADSHFVYEWINPAFAAVLGVDAEEVCGTTWWRWCEPLDIPRVSQIMDAAALEQRNWSVEFGAGRPGGPYSRLLMVAAPRIAAAGEIFGWTGICFDVTHGPSLGSRLESMSGMLTADTARSQLLLRQFPGVIWTTDTQLRCTSTIGAGLAALDQAPNEVVGLTIPQLRGTDDPEHPVIRAHRVAVQGESASYDDAWIGRHFSAHIEPLRDAAGNIVGCIGISRDITERLESFARNERLARQLALAQRIGRIGSWEFEVATGSFLWSDEGYRLLGLEPGSVEPTSELFFERVHPDDRQRMIRLHAVQLRSGEGYVVDYRLIGPDGGLRTMRGTVEFEFDAPGVLVRVIGVLQDLTPPTAVPGPSGACPSMAGVDPPASATE